MGNKNTAATDRYRKQNVTQVIVRFFPAERPLLEHLEAQGAKATYIKRLIADDMAKDLPAWKWVEREHGNPEFTNGEQWLEYIGREHGMEAFELHNLRIDGEVYVITIRTEHYSHEEAGAEANRLLAKLRTGWRPVNW